MTPYRDRLHAGHYSPGGKQEQPEADDQMTIDELKDALRERDLPVSGSKAELQARLDEADD